MTESHQPTTPATPAPKPGAPETFEAECALLIAEIYQGLLGREPDPSGMRAYVKFFERGGDVSKMLAELVASPEFRHKFLAASKPADTPAAAPAPAAATRGDTLAALAPDIVQACYHGLLNRKADPGGLAAKSAALGQSRDLAGMLRRMIESVEFKRYFLLSRPMTDPRRSYEQPCSVFIHIQKTGGTCLRNLLAGAFPAEKLFQEHADTLFRWPPGELTAFSIFAGHFNHDSLAYIPRKTLSLYAFVRQPAKRLVSLYNFWRAHEPGHPSYNVETQAANVQSLAECFQNPEINRRSSVWNHMTWAIMGQRQWSAWLRTLPPDGAPVLSEDFIKTVAKPAIRKRLAQFTFVGLQERFDESIATLFTLLGKPVPATIPTDHSLDQLAAAEPHFKRDVAKERPTPEAEGVLAGLTQLDDIVYHEAVRLFGKRPARADTSAGTG